MRTSDRGVVALIAHEGIVPGPYLDSVGVWTFGIGHTAAAGAPDPAKMRRGMPADLGAGIAEAFAVFRKDLVKYEQAVNRAVRVPMAQHEFDALVSFHYNTGGIGRAKITHHLNAGNRAEAAKAFMGWTRPKEIIPRRKAEQKLFATGAYPGGNLTVWGVTEAGKVVWRPVKTLTPSAALDLARGKAAQPKPAQPAPAQPKPQGGLVAAILALLARIFGGKA